MKNALRVLLILGLAMGLAVPVLAVDELSGAGATFPYPLYSKMFDAYASETGVKVNYQGIGSSGGIKELTNKTVDFGGTDAFMSDEKIAETGADIVHIPTCLGAVVLTYNLEGSPELKISQDVLADIFLGKITSWNDDAIAALNPGVSLPDMDIVVVHRSDGSGTTNTFTVFLTKINDEWADTVGKGKTVEWPTGLGAAKNSGVAGMIKQTPGAIGYVELAYATENGMPVALIENSSGNFIKPDLMSTSLSAEGDIPEDTRVYLADTSAAEGYPITTFTWIILYKEQNYDGRTLEEAKALMDLLWWVTHDGQVHCEPLLYAPIPEKAVGSVENLLKSITYDGKPILD